jgi:hypothetical protein
MFRLGGMYLNFAEAALYLNLPEEALNFEKGLRQRANIHSKATIDETIIQNEPMVKLSWENHSYWNISLWRITRLLFDGAPTKDMLFTYYYYSKKYRIIMKNIKDVTKGFYERNYYLHIGINRTSENITFIDNPDY